MVIGGFGWGWWMVGWGKCMQYVFCSHGSSGSPVRASHLLKKVIRVEKGMGRIKREGYFVGGLGFGVAGVKDRWEGVSTMELRKDLLSVHREG